MEPNAINDMTKAPAYKYLVAGDYAGEAVVEVMSLLPELEAIISDRKNEGDTSSEEDMNALRSLQKAFNNRDPFNCWTGRHIQYFKSIFPDLEKMDDGYTAKLIRRGAELYQLKRLILVKPTEWPEQKIFAQERDRDRRLLSDSAFIKARDDFKSRYGTIIDEKIKLMGAEAFFEALPDSNGYETYRLAGYSYLTAPAVGGDNSTSANVKQMPDAVVFQQGINNLCQEFTLLGLKSDLTPVSRIFEIRVEDGDIKLCIPYYLKWDKRRFLDMCKDVLGVIEHRQRSQLPCAVRRSYVRASSANKTRYDAHAVVEDLKHCLKRKPKPSQRAVIIEMNNKHKLSQADDEEDRIRSALRIIKRICESEGITF